MEEWKEYNIKDAPKVSLAELLDFIVDNRGKTVPTSASGIPLIATNCIKNDLLYPTFEKIRYVSDDIFKTWFRAHPKPGDIIFVNKGTPGKTALVPNPVNFCFAQDMIAFRVKKHIVYNKYLLAVLRSRPILKFIDNSQVGTIIPHFKKEQLKTILIPLPKMEIQKKIGDLYFFFSEKCEVNRRICENLEAQAQALFKHWFIDFAPFKNGNFCANREQNETCFNSAEVQPKITGKACKFVESELGMIPEGWRVGTLTEIAEYLNGLAMQKFPPLSADDSIPVLKIKELGQSQCDSNSDKCSKQIKPEYIIKNGDVVFSWSGTLMVDIWCGGICGLNQHLFKVTSDTYPKWFYLMWTKHHLAEFIRIAKDKAVTMGHIKRGDLEKALVAIPDSDTLDKMSKVMEDIYNQIINTRLESNSLSTLRDTLLPKLMSGQIKV